MILNIRGAQGSGKTTIVQQVMELYPEREAHYVEGRKNPVWYTLHALRRKPLRVIGHYESHSGGVDSFSLYPPSGRVGGVATIYKMISSAAELHQDVLYEGYSLVANDLPEIVELHRRYPVTVVVLTTSAEVCCSSVTRRRLGLNLDPDPRLEPGHPDHPERRIERIELGARRLEELGVTVLRLSREETLREIKRRFA